MSDLSIRIKIAEREYPMRVDESEEQRLRMAGRLLNERIRFFKEEFRIDDKQDLLAMVAFECMADKLKLEQATSEADQLLTDKLQQLQKMVAAGMQA